MNAPGPRCYAFEQFHFDPLQGRLSNGGAMIELRPKSLAVLQYLLAHAQRLVQKEELLDAVWGKVVVTEDSLVQCVGKSGGLWVMTSRDSSAPSRAAVICSSRR